MEGAGVGGWAHPRSRGENLNSTRTRDAYPGSSPLTRGKRVPVPIPVDMERLIPAHAGKTCSQARSLGSRAAHPRSRGENLTDPSRQLQDPGSSPLTRGKRLPRYHWYQFYRLIPAHAGKTRRSAPQSGASPAHPRSRGENMWYQNLVPGFPGSSPLTRGKLDPPPLQPSEERLIPAHAGKTRSTAVHPIGRRAHPRSRGENLHPLSPIRTSEGSSPLTRGKRFCPPHGGRFVRLIPAHAGKTAAASSDDSPIEAHPRSRGENRELKQDDTGACGSSPLTRGKLAGATVSAPIPRLIPAHAGKTSRGHERLPS